MIVLIVNSAYTALQWFLTSWEGILVRCWKSAELPDWSFDPSLSSGHCSG